MPSAYVVNNAAAGLNPLTAFLSTGSYVDLTQRPFLIDGRMDKQVEFVSDYQAVVVFDFGGGILLRGWGVLNHNMAGADSPQVLIEGADNSTFSTNLVTAKAASNVNQVVPRHRDAVFQFATINRRYWRLTFSFGIPFAFRLGELIPYQSTDVIQLSRGYTDGSSEPEEILSVGVQMMYGERRDVFLGGPMRHKRMRFQDYTAAQNAELMTMWRATKGPVNPLLWIESYEAVATAAAAAQQNCIYGKLDLQTFEAPYTDFDLVQPNELIIRQKGRGVGQ